MSSPSLKHITEDSTVDEMHKALFAMYREVDRHYGFDSFEEYLEDLAKNGGLNAKIVKVYLSVPEEFRYPLS